MTAAAVFTLMATLRRLARMVICGSCVLMAAGIPASADPTTTAKMEADSPLAPDEPVSYRRDVQAVLSRAGCNMGACHGNQAGKGGFWLALRGQDAAADYQSIVDDLSGRRVNRVSPTDSLLLLKPTGQVPHAGGVRFAVDSLEYETLRRWIEAGTPDDDPAAAVVTKLEVTPADTVLFRPTALVGDSSTVASTSQTPEIQLAVRATYADGRQRDVTPWAVYETTSLSAAVDRQGRVKSVQDGETTIMVRYLNQQTSARVAFMPASQRELPSAPRPANSIDRLVQSKLARLNLPSSGLCNDTEFLRRTYLDVTGLLPPPDVARSFLRDSRPDKRSRLIDQLLQRPEFAEHWALKWSDVLRNEEKVLDTQGVDLFHGWIRRSFAEGKPLNRFAAELVSSLGSTYENPPTNFYRAHRDAKVRAVAVARVFLGYRLQCAECHNHPYDTWTQKDYYDWAAVFARVGYEIKDNKRRDEFDKHEFVGEQIVHENETQPVTYPRNNQPATARLLGQSETLASDRGQLDQLAEWLTSPDNRDFARAQVNRIWFHLLGRGLVDPVDDFRVTNPPSHPELLEYLADELIGSDYDVRHVMRLILNSVTYQAAIRPDGETSLEGANYGCNVERRLTAEQLLDAQARVLGVTPKFVGYAGGTRAGQLTGVQRRGGANERPTPADRFLRMFGKPDRLLACECERTQETHLGQALALTAGESLNGMLTDPTNRIGQRVGAGASPAEIITELYWWALSRPPGETELTAAEHVVQSGDPRTGLEDVAWALLNSREFLFRP
ncbi:MAG: DUF1549 domain-containing protein [Pirellulales bacterium]